MTTKQPTSDSNFSIDKLYLGERNADVINRWFSSADAEGYRIMAYILPLINGDQKGFYTKPASNCKFRIKSQSAGDDADVQLTYVDVTGAEKKVTLTANGTSNVDSSEALGIMINDAVCLTTPIGHIEVWIDNLNNGSFTTRIGYIDKDNGWQSTLYLVPKGRKMICRRVGLLNFNFYGTYNLQLWKWNNWISGERVGSILAFMQYYWQGQTTKQTELFDAVFNEGDLCYIRASVIGSAVIRFDYQYIAFDK